MPKIDQTTRELMLESLKHYAEEKLPFDFIRACDAQNKHPDEIIKDMYKTLGVNLLLVPRAYGGLGGTTSDIYRICEILARVDLGIATSVFATFLGSDPINVGGTEEQKKYWFSRIAKENMIVAYGATEADAGSDLIALKTRAERVEEGGKIIGYKISGSKMWISSGGIADLYTVLALTPKGPSWFLLERGMQGFTQDSAEDKHGIRLANTAGLSFDEVFVPVQNLIGETEGQGLQQAQAVFGYTRLMVAALGLGAGEEAIEIAVDYALHRVQAGGPLAEKQGYMQKLIVPHYIAFEAARAFIDQTAKSLDSDNHGMASEGAIAKYFATEAGNAAAEDAIQALGGFGYTKDFSVEKIKRDVKITCIYEGTNEIMEMTIYRARWQEHLKTRGQYYIDMAFGLEQAAQKEKQSGLDSGCEVLALGLRALCAVLEVCRQQRLTRHQFVTFQLGKLIAKAETARALCLAAASDSVPEGSPFDADTYKAIARVNAKETAFYLAQSGAALVQETLPKGAINAAELLKAVNLEEIASRLDGVRDDKDVIAAKMRELFRK